MDRVLVDSSVWIAHFRGQSIPEIKLLDALIDDDGLLIGDLILLEVLQGFSTDKKFAAAKRELLRLPVVSLCGEQIAVAAAQNYRALRAVGVTVRKTIDMVIGTYCIANSVPLLHADRDFDPMEAHFGLIAYRG